MNILLRLKQGFGDNCQFSIVVAHIRHYHPDWHITVQSPLGTQDIYRGLADVVEPIKYPWRNKKYDKSIYVHFGHPQWEWGWLPSTKATQCLTEELKALELEPIPELFHYHCTVSDEQRERAAAWYDTLPDHEGIVWIHTEGNSNPQDKNLSRHQINPVIDYMKTQGYLPINLLFQCPEYGLEQLWNVDGDGRDKRFYADAGMLLALFQLPCCSMIGIDSGPEHLATLATNMVAHVVWKHHHPLKCFDLSPNPYLRHYVPVWNREMVESQDATEYFREEYNHVEIHHEYEACQMIRNFYDPVWLEQSPVEEPTEEVADEPVAEPVEPKENPADEGGVSGSV